MHIDFKYNNEIDKEKWDKTVSKSYDGILYAYSWVLDALCDDWNALIAGDYEYIFPLPTRKKLFINYIYQPFFIQQLGLFSSRQITSEILERFISAIPSKYKWIDLNLNTYNIKFLDNIKHVKRVTSELDIIASHEQIAKNYSENVQRNIKKAFKEELLAVNISPDIMVDFFIKCQGNKFPEIKNADYERLKRMLFLAISKGKGFYLGAYDKKNNLRAIAAFIESNGKVIYLLSASDETGKSFGAMHFLIDHFIKKNCQRNLTLDFEGSQIESLLRFYLSFGAKTVHYPKILINRLPYPLNLLKK